MLKALWKRDCAYTFYNYLCRARRCERNAEANLSDIYQNIILPAGAIKALKSIDATAYGAESSTAMGAIQAADAVAGLERHLYAQSKPEFWEIQSEGGKLWVKMQLIEEEGSLRIQELEIKANALGYAIQREPAPVREQSLKALKLISQRRLDELEKGVIAPHLSTSERDDLLNACNDLAESLNDYGLSALEYRSGRHWQTKALRLSGFTYALHGEMADLEFELVYDDKLQLCQLNFSAY